MQLIFHGHKAHSSLSTSSAPAIATAFFLAIVESLFSEYIDHDATAANRYMTPVTNDWTVTCTQVDIIIE